MRQLAANWRVNRCVLDNKVALFTVGSKSVPSQLASAETFAREVARPSPLPTSHEGLRARGAASIRSPFPSPCAATSSQRKDVDASGRESHARRFGSIEFSVTMRGMTPTCGRPICRWRSRVPSAFSTVHVKCLPGLPLRSFPPDVQGEIGRDHQYLARRTRRHPPRPLLPWSATPPPGGVGRARRTFCRSPMRRSLRPRRQSGSGAWRIAPVMAETAAAAPELHGRCDVLRSCARSSRPPWPARLLPASPPRPRTWPIAALFLASD